MTLDGGIGGVGVLKEVLCKWMYCTHGGVVHRPTPTQVKCVLWTHGTALIHWGRHPVVDSQVIKGVQNRYNCEVRSEVHQNEPWVDSGHILMSSVS